MHTRKASSDARLVRLADALSVPDGGFTVDPRTGGDVRTGYGLSVYPERERQIGGKVTPEDIRQYAYDNADLLAIPGNLLGGWRDPETGIAFLDVSTVRHDRDDALFIARQNGQLAIFDFRYGVSISAALTV